MTGAHPAAPPQTVQPPSIAGLITSVQEDTTPDRRQMRPSRSRHRAACGCARARQHPIAMCSTATGPELCRVARSMPNMLCCWPDVLLAACGSIRMRVSGWPTDASGPAYLTDDQLGLLPCETGYAVAVCCADGFWMTGRHLLRAAEDV